MARSLKPYGPGTATFSPCETYRYELTRDLSGLVTGTRSGLVTGRSPTVLVSIGLNPSTATCDDDDPTVHKESLYAINWRHATFIKTNAYGFRATVPADMFAAKQRGIDIVGPGNDDAIRAACLRVKHDDGRVLVAWGKNIERERQQAIALLLADVGVDAYCMGVNKDGSPGHPLYLPNSRRPTRWTCPIVA